MAKLHVRPMRVTITDTRRVKPAGFRQAGDHLAMRRAARSVLTGTSLTHTLLRWIRPGNVVYQIGDGLGGTTAVTSATGAVSGQLYYEPYGQTTGTPSSAFPFAYTGRVAVLGNIYYNRARFYDAVAGRFLSEDPLGYSAGINQYSYANGNPAAFTDPQGKFIWILAGGLIGGVVNTGFTYIANGGNVTGTQLAAAFGGGFVAGALGAAAGPLGGTIALELGLGSSGGIAAIGSAAVLSAGASAAGQEVSNLIDPCHPGNVADAALWGGLGGAVGKYFPTRNLNTWKQASYFRTKTVSGLFGTSNAWWNLGSFGTSAGVGAATNFPAARSILIMIKGMNITVGLFVGSLCGKGTVLRQSLHVGYASRSESLDRLH